MCVCVCLSVVLPVRLPAGLPVGLPAGLPAGLSVGLSVCLLSAWVKRYMMYMYIDVNLTCIYVSTCVCIPKGQLQRCRHPCLQLNGCVWFQVCTFFFHE